MKRYLLTYFIGMGTVSSEFGWFETEKEMDEFIEDMHKTKSNFGIIEKYYIENAVILEK